MGDRVVAQVPVDAVEAAGAGTFEGADNDSVRVANRESRAVLDRAGKPVVEVGAVGGLGAW